VAERFELYLDGIEICNGYQELTDGEELRRRMEDRSLQRSQAGKPPLPAQSRLLTAMRECRLPECSGVALGFDRLVMWLLGKSSIADVMSFSRDRA
jgi:lysyl-tRNA synthetase class 2